MEAGGWYIKKRTLVVHMGGLQPASKHLRLNTPTKIQAKHVLLRCGAGAAKEENSQPRGATKNKNHAESFGL